MTDIYLLTVYYLFSDCFWSFFLIFSFMFCWFSLEIYLDFFIVFLCMFIGCFWYMVTIRFVYRLFRVYIMLMFKFDAFFSPLHILWIYYILCPFCLCVSYLTDFYRNIHFYCICISCLNTITFSLSIPLKESPLIFLSELV